MSEITSTVSAVSEQEEHFDEEQFMMEMHSGIARAVRSAMRRFALPMLLCLMLV